MKTDKKLQWTAITVWTAYKILQKILRAFLINYINLFLLYAKSLYQYHTKRKQVKIKQVVIKLQVENDSQAASLEQLDTTLY